MSTVNNRIISRPISYQELRIIKKSKIHISGIYKIENLITHKVYIGQSKDIIYRLWSHLQPKGEQNIVLRNDFIKYGFDSFSFEILKETYDLDYWEIFLIQLYKATDEEYGYNVSVGGIYPRGERYNQILSRALMGHKLSEETKRKIGLKAKGRESPNKGKHPSEETRRKQRLAKLGTHLSAERKKYLSNKNKGLRWYTNGTIEVFSREKPVGEEWNMGRLKHYKEV